VSAVLQQRAGEPLVAVGDQGDQRGIVEERLQLARAGQTGTIRQRRIEHDDVGQRARRARPRLLQRTSDRTRVAWLAVTGECSAQAQRVFRVAAHE